MPRRRWRNSRSAKRPPSNWRMSVSRVPAAPGSRTAIASCGCRPAKWIEHSAACRCSNWMGRRACARFSEPPHFGRRSRPLELAQCGDFALRRRTRVEGDTVGELTMRSTVNPEFLGLAATDPQMLTLHGLASYIDHLAAQQSGDRILRDRLLVAHCQAFCRDHRDAAGAALCVRPAAHHRSRNPHGGRRACLGVVFFLITRTIENGGQLFDLNPALVGWLPHRPSSAVLHV